MDSNNYPTRDSVRTCQYMAGRVKRWHTWPTIHQETVDEHSMGVLRIYRQIFGLSTVSVVKCIMDHDLPEIVAGDPPYPVKRDNPDLKKAYDAVEAKARKMLELPTDYSLSEKEKWRVKVCDLLQMWQFGRAEMHMGNGYAFVVVTDTAAAALTIAKEWLGAGEYDMIEGWMREESAR